MVQSTVLPGNGRQRRGHRARLGDGVAEVVPATIFQADIHRGYERIDALARLGIAGHDGAGAVVGCVNRRG
jgi:hypothetical protein